MTVCICAICDSGKSVVVAADRQVTFGPPLSLQTELPSDRKIHGLTSTIVALYSGHVPDGEEIISKVKGQIPPSQKILVNDIAEKVKTAYIDLKRKRQEETILRPWLGTDFQTFQQMLAGAALSTGLQQIMGALMQHSLGLDVLVAGLDDTGAHLHVATNPGVLLPLDTLGYAAIGTGGLHASIRLTLGKQSKLCKLAETVYNVYEAKKAAEVAPGVGQETDMDIISNGKIATLKKSSVERLVKLHKERPGLSETEIKELEQECKQYVQ